MFLFFERDVKFSSGNEKVLDILCGTHQCSPATFVNFLGSNPETPFIFNINITDSSYLLNGTIEIIPHNSTAFICNSTVISEYYNGSACGCSVRLFKNLFK